MYWKGVSQENNRLMNRIFKIDKVAETFPTFCNNKFSVSGENCGAEAGDDVLASSLLIFECEVPRLLPGELQHLLCGVRAQVRLEEAAEEEES